MIGVYYVAIAVLVVVSSQTAAGLDQSEAQQTSDDAFMVSVHSSNKMLRSRVLRESRNPKDDSMLSANNEERMPSAPSGFLTNIKASDSIIPVANAMRTKGGASAFEAASKNLHQLVSIRRKRIASTPNNVKGQVLHAPNNPYTSPVSAANDKALILAKRPKTKRLTAIMENIERSATQHNDRPAPLEPSTINAEAPNGRLNNQLNTQKAFKLDKSEHLDKEKKLREEDLVSVHRPLHFIEEYDKPAHPIAVDRHEASAISTATKNLNQLRHDKHKRKRIAASSNIVDEQVLHSPPDLDEFPVVVADDIPSVLAERLNKKHPTAIMENAANALKRHDYRPALSSPSTIKAEASNGRRNNQPIIQKPLQLDKNEHVDESFMREELVSVKELLLLFEEYFKSAHPTGQSGPIDSTDNIAQGPKLMQKIEITGEIEKIHEAFLKAFSLPFRQYIQETATMLKVVRWTSNSSPNNVGAIATFRNMANIQDLKKLPTLLGSDLAKLLGNEDMELPRNLENLKEAFTVKLLIMYDLFYKFCYHRKDLVEGLPREIKPSTWVLKLSIANSGNSHH